MSKDTINNSTHRQTTVQGYGLEVVKEGDINGTVTTPYGVVEVFSDPVFESEWSGKRYMPSCHFSMILNGRHYWRGITRHNARPFTKLGLATMAGRFAREIYISVHAPRANINTSPKNVEVSLGR